MKYHCLSILVLLTSCSIEPQVHIISDPYGPLAHPEMKPSAFVAAAKFGTTIQWTEIPVQADSEMLKDALSKASGAHRVFISGFYERPLGQDGKSLSPGGVYWYYGAPAASEKYRVSGWRPDSGLLEAFGALKKFLEQKRPMTGVQVVLFTYETPGGPLATAAESVWPGGKDIFYRVLVPGALQDRNAATQEASALGAIRPAFVWVDAGAHTPEVVRVLTSSGISVGLSDFEPSGVRNPQVMITLERDWNLWWETLFKKTKSDDNWIIEVPFTVKFHFSRENSLLREADIR